MVSKKLKRLDTLLTKTKGFLGFPLSSLLLLLAAIGLFGLSCAL